METLLILIRPDLAGVTMLPSASAYSEAEGEVLALVVIWNDSEKPSDPMLLLVAARNDGGELVDIQEVEVGVLAPDQHRPVRVSLRDRGGAASVEFVLAIAPPSSQAVWS